MGRPTRVYPKSLPQYNLLHTRKAKMYCGTEITGLHLVKETDQFHMGLETWSHCVGPFKQLKFGKELNFDIPVVTNEKSIEFLNKNAWHDWVAKQLKSEKRGDIRETIAFLDRLFPDKKKTYFYELESFISTYCHGSFLSYDDNGNIEEPSEHDIKQRKYYTGKYYRGDGKFESEEVKKLYDAYDKVRDSDKAIKDKAFTKYYDAEQDYVFNKYNLTDTFIDVSKNAVVCPYAFSDATVKGMSYEHSGEIYFVVTPDTIYFEVKRHF